jgi:hypothetical protein
MKHKLIKKLLACFFIQSIALTAYADIINDPCGGPAALLNIANRPSAADSACVVPYKKMVLELGYQYMQLTHSLGHAQNFPEATFRIGLPANNELVILLPNEIRLSSEPHSGSTATVIGIKHELGYNQRWIATIESLITLPNGSAEFGSKGIGIAINGIVSYSFNSDFNLTFMLGGSTATTASSAGGQRFNSINPDLVLTYSINPKLNLFGELYGQSKTNPGENSGFNADSGFLYLVSPSVMVDIEAGQRISGSLVGFDHYVGTGITLMI